MNRVPKMPMYLDPPTQVQVDNKRGRLELLWPDGLQQSLPIQLLRAHCPCAMCQGHGVEKRIISNDVHRLKSAKWVGRYAIGLHFADGHTTGIFRFEHLRNLQPILKGA